MRNLYNLEDILRVARLLNITFDKYPLEDLITGIYIELEHGTVNPITNVTNDDLLLTTKIALAHLNEFPDYYNKEYGLPALEERLKDKN